MHLFARPNLLHAPIREPQSRDCVMGRDVINDGCPDAAACASSDDPTADFTRAASQRVRIELEQVAQGGTVALIQLFEHPMIQRSINPTGARSARVMGKSARGHDRYSFRPILQRVCDRLAELVTSARGRHRRKIAVHVQWDNWDVELRRDFHRRPRERMAEAALGPAERYKLLGLRYVEALAL